MPDLWTRLYCGPAPVPDDLLWRWNLDPVLLAALALLTWTLRRSRPGLLATAALVVAFVSPLCALSAALFSARVVHHILLVAVAAPLLAMAWPPRRAPSPALAVLVSTAVLWAWHWPPAYDLALSNIAAYWAMQASLLGSALIFWRALLAPTQPAGQALLFVLGAYMQMALLGALLTFAPASLYLIHATAPLDWGFSPLRDQQLGGLLMWVPAGLPYVTLGAMIARRAWRGIEGRPA
jgi:putative membrane protein